MPSPAQLAHNVAAFHCQRVKDFFDAEMHAMLETLAARGLGDREKLAGLLTTAAHVSGHAQAKAELSGIAVAVSSDAAEVSRSKVREYMFEHVKRVRDLTIEETVQKLAAEQGMAG